MSKRGQNEIRITMSVCLPVSVILDGHFDADGSFQIDSTSLSNVQYTSVRQVEEAMTEDDFDEMNRIAKAAR